MGYTGVEMVRGCDWVRCKRGGGFGPKKMKNEPWRLGFG